MKLFLCLLLPISFTVSNPARCKLKPVAVVELFTSQDCSSCPLADKVLRQLKAQNRQGVFVASFHVDYWNYIGWKDPFSKKAFSQRQRAYADYLRSNRVYTPQAIVNGLSDTVGSRRGQLTTMIDSALAKPATVALRASSNLSDQRLTVNYSASCIKGDGRITALLVQKKGSRKVTRGENRGEFLSHVNIVREIKVSKNTEGRLRFVTSLKQPRAYGVLLFWQRTSDAAIMGAINVSVN